MARLALPIPQTVRFLALLLALAFAGCAASGPGRSGETIHRNVVFAQRGARSLRLDLLRASMRRARRR